MKAQVLEFDREKRRIRLGLKQLEPTTIDHYIAEHQAGETVTGRVVEVKQDRMKVELGDGVFAVCKTSPDEAEEKAGAGGADKADLSTLTAMLAARWKQGGGAETAQKSVAKPGQILSFRIVSMDPQQKKIQLEPVS